jgi:predicted TIM-barrel fold metal-dependent hydrolase
LAYQPKEKPMRDDMFIFDSVVHMYDNSDYNIVGAEGAHVAENLAGFAKLFATPQYPYKDNFLGNVLDTDEAYRLLFEESDTDIAMAQTVPLFGWWRDGFSPAQRQYAFKEAHPDRVVFCGGVDPLYQGIEGSVRELERQVVEWGAKSFKFYQAHRKGLSWRVDDPKLAYPLWEKCLELGINTVQFHKGVPFGNERMEDLKPNDIQDAATDFPDLTFIIHHLGDPYVDESISLAARNPNIWLALSAWVNIYPIMPKRALDQIGKALVYVGPDRLLWGSEAFIWPNVQGYIDIFANLEMPEELQSDYGYPALTRDIKRKIFGENFARLLGIDVEAKKHELYGEAVAVAPVDT